MPAEMSYLKWCEDIEKACPDAKDVRGGYVCGAYHGKCNRPDDDTIECSVRDGEKVD